MKQTTRVISVLLALLMAFSFTAFAADPLTVTASYEGSNLEGATVPAGGTITLAFSNNVTEDSILSANIGRIKVKDASGQAASASVSVADKTTFTVTLGSDLAKGSYTLELGKEIAAKNGSTLGQKIVYNFTVKGTGTGTGGGNNSLTVQSVLCESGPLEGKELESGAKIVIQFDRGMTDNAEANFALISVLKADGTAAAFTIETNKDKSNENAKREYIVTLGENESGSCTLVIGADVKANNGNTLGEDYTVSFTFKGVEEIVEPEVEPTPTFFDRVKAFFADLYSKMQSFSAACLTLAIDLYRKIMIFFGINTYPLGGFDPQAM